MIPPWSPLSIKVRTYDIGEIGACTQWTMILCLNEINHNQIEKKYPGCALFSLESTSYKSAQLIRSKVAILAQIGCARYLTGYSQTTLTIFFIHSA